MKTVDQIVNILNISKRRVEYRIAMWIEYEQDEPQKKGAKKKFNKEHEDFLVNHMVTFDGKLGLSDLKMAFDQAYQDKKLTISETKIYNILKENGINYKELTAEK